MMETSAPSAFFVAGGTVPPGSPSYVERAADRELFEALLAGEFCYVLNSRQMGKSSLAVRTIAKLNEAGVRTAFVDLTRLGSAGATPDRWYAGLLLDLGRALGERERAAAAIRGEGTPVGKLLGFLADVLGEQPLVVFVDEVDATRTLPFSADDLFAGVRQAANARATDPRFARLTFCLLGAALPSDLIRDPRVTPFNVGRRIELRDFTAEEARPFASQVGKEALTRVLRWTGGHPFLTQALCAELASSPLPSGGEGSGVRGFAEESRTGRPGNPIGRGVRAPEVDTLVQGRYLDARARETDTNLADVGNRLLGEGDPNVTDEDRATTLALYERMLQGKAVADDESNPAAARIKMSGVARVENGELRPRNRIYADAFDRRWVRESMPGQELRRQRRAFWKGAFRSGLVGTTVAVIIAGLAVNAEISRRRADAAESVARKQRDAARYDAYVASMQTMAQKAAEGDGETARRTLEALRGDPNRGWEWEYWKGSLDGDSKVLDWRGDDAPKIAADPFGKWLGVIDADSLTIYDVRRKRHGRLALPHASGEGYRIGAFRSGDRFVVQNRTTRLTLVIHAPTLRVLRKRTLKGFFGTQGRWNSNDDRTTLTWSSMPLRTYRLDLDTLEETSLPGVPTPVSSIYSPRHDRVVLRVSDGTDYFTTLRRASDLREIWSVKATYPYAVDFDPSGETVVVANAGTLQRIETETGRVLRSVPLPGATSGIQFSPDGKRLLVEKWGEKVQEFSAEGRFRPLRSFSDLHACYVEGGRLLTSGVEIHVRDLSARPALQEMKMPIRGTVTAIRTEGKIVLSGEKGRLELNPESPRRYRLLKPLQRPNDLLDVTGRYAMSVKDGAKILQFEDLGKRHPGFRVPWPDLGGWGYYGVSPQSDRLALPFDATHLQIYDTREGKRIATLPEMSGAAFPRFSEDGRWLATGDESGIVSVWDTSDWRRAASARLGHDEIQCLSFSPDGGRVAMGSKFGDLGVLDFRKGVALRFDGITQAVADIAWSPDGKRLASGGSDREIRLWDTTTGRDLGVVGRHDAQIISLWFTSDGRTLCSVDSSGVLKLLTAEASK